MKYVNNSLLFFKTTFLLPFDYFLMHHNESADCVTHDISEGTTLALMLFNLRVWFTDLVSLPYYPNKEFALL